MKAFLIYKTMIYQTTMKNEVSLMWQETDKKKRQKGLHVTKFNVMKDITLNIDDRFFLEKDEKSMSSKFWVIEKIIETRDSSIKNYNYVACECSFLIEKV